MLISSETSPLVDKVSLKEAIKMLKDAGFEAYDASLCDSNNDEATIKNLKNYKEVAQDIRKYADSIGMICNQAHATYPTFPSGTFEGVTDRTKMIEREMEIASILGAKIICIHPLCLWTPEENAKMFKLFEEAAKKYNIKIGIENMFTFDTTTWKATARACNSPESFVKHIDALNSPYFVALLDVGHAKAVETTSPEEIIRALGNQRLQALHIHDTELHKDRHGIPYTYKNNFEEICKALKEINYNGDITFEVETIRNFPLELRPSVLKLLADIGKYFRKLIQE